MAKVAKKADEVRKNRIEALRATFRGMDAERARGMLRARTSWICGSLGAAGRK